MQSILFFPHLALDASDANVQRTKRRVVIEENNYSANTFAKSFLTEFYGYCFGSGNGQKASLNLPTAEATQSPKSISEFTVYPNPASNELNIVLAESFIDQEIEVNLYDLLGVVAQKRKLLASTINPIGVSSLPKGYYLLQVVTPNGNFNTRIIINK